uniref:Uncharacterized protein n=1 Tax=Proboscia inermis TaxID=420281 RepID=A0A7S0GE41_9STRA|mmetsp:Transcript_31101/g.31376  ORF Transcript_31101/g.31376 Transcript_31101/m.31376 type:complete len:585 (+) Transcript_31101:867-2621(+)|eukprot:CAMPEP_0171316140 /NCGR_PEP_ID=MMETSP0816-20121228/70417_1 /TAXON_ID=420281 /ORGANISM="Proboscia inermis, Strain CCAP1064/1" /LENGTH=584 /DNA_ID=CAMNT_0011807701 /DNA_START=859 /DNA_END=2613 /DNA_ORIENTATION=-
MNDTFTDLNDLLLHRLDSFDEFTRRSLQIFAVLGFEFSFSEVLAIQCHGLDNAETSAHMKRIQEALDASVKENILEEAHSGEKRSRKNTEHTRKAMKRFSKTFKIVERQYTFSHAMWRNCVLGTMLNETERDIHRFIANIMEGDNYEVHSYISAMKLFHHWKASGDIMHASLLAMKIGKHLENLLLQHQVIDFYFEVISMWKDFSGDENEEDVIAGMGHGVLSRLTREELDCLARLHTSIAKAYANIGDGTNANLFYSNCDFILTNSPAAADLKDRTVFFILYSAQFGLLQSLDVKNKLVIQTELAKKFVEQAQIHGDPVHIARALAMEGLVLAGRGMFEDAIDAQKRLEKIYFAEKHSAGVINEYATDRAAQSYGYSVIWYATLGRHEECQAQIDFILDNLLPKMPKKNVHNSFMILFQSLWVLKDRGHVRLAEFVFVKHIYDRFNEYYSKGSSTFFYVVYEPIRVLLRLAVESKEGKDTDERKRKELEGWILSEDFFVGSPGKIRAIPMCSLGRDPHCIIAEICLLLAAGRKTFDERRMQLLRKGAEEANKSNKYTQCNPGYAYSQKQSLSIMGEIQRMIML